MPDENEIEDLDLSDIESDADNASEDPFAEETVGRSLNDIIIRPFDPSQIRFCWTGLRISKSTLTQDSNEREAFGPPKQRAD